MTFINSKPIYILLHSCMYLDMEGMSVQELVAIVVCPVIKEIVIAFYSYKQDNHSHSENKSWMDLPLYV